MSSDQIGFQFETTSNVQSSKATAADESEPASNAQSNESKSPHIFSVSELNSVIRGTLETKYTRVWLRGEISNFKPHSSGHHYFSLKDDGAQVNAVMFRGFNSKLKFKPENGLEVLVRGKITVYEPRGTYQIFCETMEPVGAGALQKAFEQLKAKLQKEGLFDLAKKRKLPTHPKHIGIVTSPTGAAIKDILNVLRRRHQAARITLAPAIVQGDAAPASIVAAIQMINKLKDVDVLIVGRGGGSVEDLWAFNDERVARAIADSRIPTISAVGHEVDFTIADFVADLRAPTPSAAAELVVQNADELIEKIETLTIRLSRSIQTHFRALNEKIHSLKKRLIDPQRKLQDLQIRNDELATRLESAVFRFIEDRRRQVLFARQKMGSPREMIDRILQRVQFANVKLTKSIEKLVDIKVSKLKTACAQLDAMSPLRVVARGYSIVETLKGEVITDTKQVQSGDEISVRLAKGQLTAKVTKLIATTTK